MCCHVHEHRSLRKMNKIKKAAKVIRFEIRSVEARSSGWLNASERLLGHKNEKKKNPKKVETWRI